MQIVSVNPASLENADRTEATISMNSTMCVWGMKICWGEGGKQEAAGGTFDGENRVLGNERRTNA